MRVRAILPVLALTVVALSGCASDEPPVPAQTPDETTEPLDSTNETLPPVNTPPVAELVASMTNGTAPLNVTFTLDGGDADGDNLTWTFTVGNTTDNGTDLPATIDATLEAGNWTATLVVSDGENETVQTIVVAVAEAVDGVGEPAAIFTGTSMSGSSPVARDTSGVSPCVSFTLLENGIDCYYFPVPGDLAGRSFTVESSAGSADVGFWEDCDPLFYAHVADEYSGAGTIPDGTGCAVLWYYGLATDGVEFTFTVL